MDNRKKKKRRQKEIKKYLRFFAAWGILLALVAAVIIIVVSCANRHKKSRAPEQSQQQTESINAGNSAENNSGNDAGKSAGNDAGNEMESGTASSDIQNGTSDAETASEAETGKTSRSTSEPVVNEQISLDGLDTERYGWWFGGETDEYNRSLHCLELQEKYGDMSLVTLGDWEPGDPKIIYLTMDEGYENGYTPSILDTLKEKNVKCVFFCTLPFVEEEPELVQRMIYEGHQVANHSVYHPSEGLPYETVEEQQYEVMGVHDYVKEHFDYEMHLFRFPAGRYSEQSLAIVNNCNYKSVFWSYAYGDYDTENQPDYNEALSAALESLHPGAIYLLHAISSTNDAMLGEFIDRTREQGYEFALLQ